MANEAIFKAACFADICQSTRIYEVLGNQQAQEVVADVLETMADVIAAHQGVVIKSAGDGLLATFDNPVLGLRAVKEMAVEVSLLPHPGRGLSPLMIHTGLHWGDVVEREGDVFGDAVNLAQRLSDMAKPGQILTTADTLATLGDSEPDGVRHLTRRQLRGSTTELEIYEVQWDEVGSTTSVRPAPHISHTTRPQSLTLRVAGQELTLGPTRPSATLGRGPQNDLVVPERWASRVHCQIELRWRRFMLKDQSTNGTFVRGGDGSRQFLKLDEFPLEGSGTLCLGREDSAAPVVFEVTLA